MHFKIRFKIFLAFLTIVILSSVSVGVGVFYSVRKNLTENLISRMSSNSDSEVSVLSDLLTAKDVDGVYNYIFNERYARKDMAYIIVLDENEKILASTLLKERPDSYVAEGKLQDGQNNRLTIINSNYGQIYSVARTLNYNKGTLISGYYEKESTRSLISILFVLLLVVIASVFFTMAVAYFVVNYVFDPLTKLIKTSEKVGAGDLSVRAKIESDDEIGSFAAVFNNMLESVQKYQNSILTLEKKKYQDLVENSPLCIKILDQNKKIEFVNKGCREEHNLSENQDVSAWDWTTTIDEKYRTSVIEKIDQAYRDGQSSKMNIKHLHDGSTREWCSTLINPVKDENGVVKKVLILSSDITQLKNAESQAEQNSRIFKNLIDSLPFCVKWYDNNGNLISINKYGKDEHFLVGKSDEEIRKTIFKSNVREEYRIKVSEGMESAKSGVQKSFEIRHIEGTAKTDWVNNTYVPIKDSEGQVKYILMISREITEEKKIEEERQKNLQRSEETKLALYNILEDAKESERVLQEERDLSQTIISSMGECLVVMTGDFKVVLMNQKASEIIGISPEEAVGLDYRDLVQVYDKEHNNLGVDRPIERVFENHELVSIELEDNMFYKCLRNNRYFPVIGVATPLKHIDGNMAIMVFQDATKIKALDEAKSSFISVASHQLRTPLTSIRWYVEMLSSNDANNLNEEQKDFVERAYHNVLKLSETINLLLNMARVESGKSNNDKSAVKLDNLVKEVIKEQDPAIKQKNLSVNITNNVSDLPTVNIDAIMLRQVIGNLISNSIRYTDKSGIIEVEISKNDIELVCSVKDNGIGIPEAEKGKIFDKFFRATNAVSKVPDGSGLGLSLVKALVESFRGKLSFESPIIWKNEKGEEIKRGTKFTFTIPLN